MEEIFTISIAWLRQSGQDWIRSFVISHVTRHQVIMSQLEKSFPADFWHNWVCSFCVVVSQYSLSLINTKCENVRVMSVHIIWPSIFIAWLKAELRVSSQDRSSGKSFLERIIAFHPPQGRCRTSSHHRWEQHKGLIPRSHFQNWWWWSLGEAQLVQDCPTDIRESPPCCQACWVLPPGSPLTAATATIPPQDTGFLVPWPKPFLEWLGQVSSPSPILWSLTAGPGWRGGTAREPAWTIRFSRISVWHLAWSSCCWCSSTYSWYMAGSFTIICVSTFNPLLLTSLLVQATKYSSWI